MSNEVLLNGYGKLCSKKAMFSRIDQFMEKISNNEDI